MTEGKKRLNPVTGKPFVSGDIREDGYVFERYHPIRKRDGYLKERWMSPDYIQKRKEYDLKRNRLKKTGKKRINPETNKPFVSGDVKDGLVFHQHNREAVDSQGYFTQHWISLEQYTTRKQTKAIARKERLKVWPAYIAKRLQTVKLRAKQKKLSFNLDLEYLFEIYPADGLCPVLGFPMTHLGSDISTSPSLDRVDNSLGYVKGNVAWVSTKANTLKSDFSVSELKSILDYMEQFQRDKQKD